MSAVVDWAVGAALVVGLFFHTMGVLGILRFPDVYTRLHADTKATTFGSIFIALAAILTAVREGVAAAPGGGGAWANVACHIAFAVVVLAVTNATGGHAIARAAWRAGHRPAGAVVDAMAADEAAKAAAPAPDPEALPETGEAPAAAEAPVEAEAPAEEAAPDPETPDIALEPQAKPDVPEIPDIPEAPEAPVLPEIPEEPRPEAAVPEAAARGETFPKAASAGWAAVLGITAEDPLLEASEPPLAEPPPAEPSTGEEEKP